MCQGGLHFASHRLGCASQSRFGPSSVASHMGRLISRDESPREVGLLLAAGACGSGRSRQECCAAFGRRAYSTPWPSPDSPVQAATYSACPSSSLDFNTLNPCPCLSAGGTLHFSLLQPNCQVLLVQPSPTTKADTAPAPAILGRDDVFGDIPFLPCKTGRRDNTRDILFPPPPLS